MRFLRAAIVALLALASVLALLSLQSSPAGNAEYDATPPWSAVGTNVPSRSNYAGNDDVRIIDFHGSERPNLTNASASDNTAASDTETDLDAFLIERTPKLDYDADPNMPQPGQAVIFYGHIRYWGDANSPVQPTVQYAWKIDGQVVLNGAINNFEPLREAIFDYTGYPSPSDPEALKNPNNWPKNPAAFPDPPPTGWRVVTLQWIWQSGRHTVELVADPSNLIGEKSEVNNVRHDYTDAISFSGWVEESTWRYFHAYQYQLGIGSNSWEDWIQRQMAKQNELYAEAIWPDSPSGVLDRVRIDRIIVVPDNVLPVNGGLPTNNPDSSDKTIDLQWGFEAYDPTTSSFYSDHISTTVPNPFYIEQSLIHELGHARYLVDSYGFDVHNTAAQGGYDSVQIWEGSTYVGGSAYMPYLAWDEVLHYNTNGGVMGGPYGFSWSPYEAAALNLIAGQRARCGNMNSPCNIGEYLQNLPLCNHLLIQDENGQPRRNADVHVYEAEAAPQQGWYGKTFDNTPDQFYTTDDAGYVNLPQNPFNPGGSIEHTYGIANGVLILRVQEGTQIWYRFVEMADFNMEYWRGHTVDAYYTLTLAGPNASTSGEPASASTPACGGATPTPTLTATPAATPTATPTPTPTATPAPTPTATPSPTAAPSVTCNGLPATIAGTAKSDVIFGTTGPDVIVSFGGNDVVFGRSGDDVICAGSGNDLVSGGEGADWIDGGEGNDLLFGGAGKDHLDGGPQYDRCFGGDGADAALSCELAVSIP